MNGPKVENAAPRAGNSTVRIWPYAGKPGESRTTHRVVRRGVYDSDNVTGAENQQERLIERQRGWVTGFVDGEGCFSIGFVRQPNRTGRKGYKTGYQVTHEFAVVQGARSLSCLHELKRFFGVGYVLINIRRDNHREHMYRYCVAKRADLMETVIPFFRETPLLTSKHHDFEKFAHCVELISAGHHLTHGGLIQLAEIVGTMNRQKPRHELIRILRDHTPDVRDNG